MTARRSSLKTDKRSVVTRQHGDNDQRYQTLVFIQVPAEKNTHSDFPENLEILKRLLSFCKSAKKKKNEFGI